MPWSAMLLAAGSELVADDIRGSLLNGTRVAWRYHRRRARVSSPRAHELGKRPHTSSMAFSNITLTYRWPMQTRVHWFACINL
jgi:hypothetical protein